MTTATERFSPRATARAAGVLYLIIIVGGVFAQIGVRERLVVAGDAAATAHNILSHALLYRCGFAAEVFCLLCNVPINYLLYQLFGFIDRRTAVTMVLFASVGTAVEAVSLLTHYAPLILLADGPAASAFTPVQLQTAAYLSLKLFDYGFMIALAFFGGFCIALASLIMRARFFPRVIAGLLFLEGGAYLLNSFAHFLAPPIGDRVFPFLMVSGIAEISFCLWLLIVGVNGQKWRAQADEQGV